MKGEDSHQSAFIDYFRVKYPDVMIFAIPNGMARGDTSKTRAIRGNILRMTGVLAGVWDLYIPQYFLWVEMKSGKNRTLSKPQIAFKTALEQYGYSFFVGYGVDDAIIKIDKFMSNPDKHVNF